MKRLGMQFFLWVVLPLLVVSAAFCQSEAEVSGIIIPRDNNGMYVRNEEGQFEVNWTSKTKVALVANTRLLSGLKADRLAYKIQSSKEVVTFAIPAGPITGIKTSRGGKQLERRNFGDAIRIPSAGVHRVVVAEEKGDAAHTKTDEEGDDS